MRNALKPNAGNRWINYKDNDGNFLIPYVIVGSYNQAKLQIIKGAMAAVAKSTCIRFVERDNQYDYVEIQNEQSQGCYTMVGRSPGKNIIMLEDNMRATCILHETVVHELMHTIGLWHEQMRHDRDKYITVHYENIPMCKWNFCRISILAFHDQFKKIGTFESTTYGIKYDYRSVMHYSKDAFSKSPGLVTMETKVKKYQDIIGKVKHASPGDFAKICNIYGCSKCMGKPFKKQSPNKDSTNDGDLDGFKIINTGGGGRNTGGFGGFGGIDKIIEDMFKFKPSSIFGDDDEVFGTSLFNEAEKDLNSGKEPDDYLNSLASADLSGLYLDVSNADLPKVKKEPWSFSNLLNKKTLLNEGGKDLHIMLISTDKK